MAPTTPTTPNRVDRQTNDLLERVMHLESFVREFVTTQRMVHLTLEAFSEARRTVPPESATPRRLIPVPVPVPVPDGTPNGGGSDDEIAVVSDEDIPNTDDDKDADEDADKDATDADDDDEDADEDDKDDDKDDDEPPAKRPKTVVKRVVMTSYTVSNGRGAPQFVICYKYGARQYETGLRAFEQWLVKDKKFGSFPAAIKAGFIIFADTFKKVVTTKKVSERQTNIMKVLLKAAKKSAA